MWIGKFFTAVALAAIVVAPPSTKAQTVYNGVSYQSTGTQDWVGQGESHAYTAPPGLFPNAYRSDPDNELQFIFYTAPTTTADWTFWNLRVAAAGGAVLTPGTYLDARRFVDATHPVLDFFGDGRGCNETFGRFTVHEVTYDPADGSILSFAADFEQHCEMESNPALFGQLRYNSSRPFSTGGGSGGARVTNLSTRGLATTGNGVLIGGFVIGGASNKTVMLRARGPSMASAGIPNTLANPTMTLHRSSDNAIIAANDNWQEAFNAAAMEWAGMQPAHANESGILISLAPGGYTAVISGVGGAQGVGLFEIFEMAQPDIPLLNIATRGTVQGGDNVLIGGIAVAGGQRTLVVRARGPSLASAGITAPLSNPTLQLVRSSDGATIATNDDWGSASNAAAIAASGFAPSDPLESAILMTLDPGNYTAIVSGVDGATGVAIVEVFSN